MQKLPIIGDYFVKEIPPSDNVSPFSFTGSSMGRALMGCCTAFLSVGLVCGLWGRGVEREHG